MILIGVLGILCSASTTLADSILIPYPPAEQYGPPALTYGVPLEIRDEEIPPAPILPPLVLPAIPSIVTVGENGRAVEFVHKPDKVEYKVPRPVIEIVETPRVIPPAPVLPPLKLSVPRVIEEINVKKPPVTLPLTRGRIFHQNSPLVSIIERGNKLYTSSPAIEVTKPSISLPLARKFIFRKNTPTSAVLLEQGLKLSKLAQAVEVEVRQEKPRLIHIPPSQSVYPEFAEYPIEVVIGESAGEPGSEIIVEAPGSPLQTGIEQIKQKGISLLQKFLGFNNAPSEVVHKERVFLKEVQPYSTPVISKFISGLPARVYGVPSF